MDAATAPTITKTVLTDAFVLAIASGFLYLVAFFYEWGYCSHFQIPINLISPNPSTVLVAAAVVGTFLVASVQLFGFAVPLLRAGTKPTSRQAPYGEVFMLNAFLLLLGAVLLRAYGISVNGFLFFLAGAAIFNFLFFGLGLMVEKGTMAERFSSIGKSRKDGDALNGWGWMEDHFGRRQTLAVMALVAFLSIAYVVGNGEAARQTRYLMLTEHPGYALLRMYGDQVIAGQVDAASRELRPGVLFFRISSEQPLRMAAEDVGPLSRRPVMLKATTHTPAAAASKSKSEATASDAHHPSPATSGESVPK